MQRRDFPAVIASTLGLGALPEPATAADEAARSYPQTATERAAGVEPLNLEYPPGQPERYLAPGFTYASIDGRSGTDFTAAINNALSVLGQPVVLGAHNYLITNLTMPAAQKLVGQGMNHTNLVCKPGSTGTMFTDRGGRSGAAKIDISGVAFYGNHCRYSHGFRLGYNTVQFGTEGVLDEIWVRDLPAGFPGIDIFGNVSQFGLLSSLSTGGMQILGSALMATKLECVDCSGFPLGSSSTVCNFGDAQIGALEVEAQASGTTAVYLTGNTHLSMLTVSLIGGFRGDCLVEIGPRATSWTIANLKLYFKDPPPALSGGNFKSGANYFGGNVTGARADGEGNYSSGLMTQGGQFGFKLQQLNAFTLRVQNPHGTLQHLIGAVGAPTTPTNVATSVRNARSTVTVTPRGPDETTPFAGGAKISTVSPDTLILDTGISGIWDVSDSAFSAHLSLNATGTVRTVVAHVAAQSVNGETRGRLHLTLLDAANGVGVPWATALAAAGSMIDVTVIGFLR
jgi:hypothetical protein